MTEINAQIPLSSMVGAINPSWGMAIRRFLNPDEWAANTVSTQLGDLASQVYELETQGNYDEARKKRFEYIKTAAQGMALPGESGAAIKQQFSSLNNALDSSSAEAIEAIKNSMSLNTAGYGNRITSPQEASQYDPNSQIKIGNAFSRNFHLIDRQSVFNDEHKRKLFNIQRGNENPYSQRTPEELADKYPKIPEINREQYQNLNDILGELQYIAQNGKTAEQRLNAAKGIVDITEGMRKLTRGESNLIPQVGLPEEIDPIFKKHGLSRYFLKPSSTVNSNGLTSNTMTPERRTDDEMKQAAMGIIYSKGLTGREQDELGLRTQNNEVTDKVRTGANLAIENIALLNQFKNILSRDAKGNVTTWTNPQTGEIEEMPAFDVGQGLEGLGEYLKANFNPFGIMQKMGVEEGDPGYLILEKLGKLLSDNYLRAASGMQTNAYEAEAFRKILIDGIASGDRTKLWTSVREAEELMKNDLAKAGRDLQSSPYIPYETRKAFRKVGLNIDPYPTIQEKEERKEDKRKILPPPTLPQKLSDKALDEFENLWNKVEPFKSMPEGTDEEKAAKLKAIQSFMLQRNNN